jgi:hypothetical protein
MKLLITTSLLIFTASCTRISDNHPKQFSIKNLQEKRKSLSDSAQYYQQKNHEIFKIEGKIDNSHPYAVKYKIFKDSVMHIDLLRERLGDTTIIKPLYEY